MKKGEWKIEEKIDWRDIWLGRGGSRGVQKIHRPAKPDPTHRVGSVFKAWWVGLGYQKNYYSGSGWVWVIKLQTRPDPPIFNIYLKYILYLIILKKKSIVGHLYIYIY